ncbi:RNA-guided pseudouridylation complex pseudouridine synthase subunit Cbf5 [Candidatus Woesearchaeota archaeon]|nr:RNA-guided pseudouridylation complex pseudouridine synthase subunit Cbf5 [Candidatus Woesearchaeota archaeon]
MHLHTIREEEGAIGVVPEERPLERKINYGIVVINKPAGPTSHQVSDYVQKILGIEKAGHSGTLDPGVTGVQPVALGDATKITTITLKSDKEYVGVMHLHKEVAKEKIVETLKKFTGTIIQMPPVKSAVKRQERPRKVYEIKLLELENQDALIRVKCEAGTYIRKLFHDIGKHLEVGANMAQLVRTKAAGFTDKEMSTLQNLSDAVYEWKEEKNPERLNKIIFPVERLVETMPKIIVSDGAIKSLTHGSTLKKPGVVAFNDFKKEEAVAIMTLKGELISIARALIESKVIEKMDKGIIAKSERVYYKEEWILN